MSHQGRSGAMVLSSTLILSLFLQFSFSQGASFTVGDTTGWNYNIQSWADGKKFKAGDTLVFNYDSSFHNVVTVDASGYNGCSVGPRSKTYTTGQDRIKLKKGKNYFICSIPGHCGGGGLKLVVNGS